VQRWLDEQPQTFFEMGIMKVPELWLQCIELQGKYVENRYYFLQKIVNNTFLLKKESGLFFNCPHICCLVTEFVKLYIEAFMFLRNMLLESNSPFEEH